MDRVKLVERRTFFLKNENKKSRSMPANVKSSNFFIFQLLAIKSFFQVSIFINHILQGQKLNNYIELA